MFFSDAYWAKSDMGEVGTGFFSSKKLYGNLNIIAQSELVLFYAK